MNAPEDKPNYKYFVLFTCGCTMFSSEDGEDRGYYTEKCIFHHDMEELINWIGEKK